MEITGIRECIKVQKPEEQSSGFFMAVCETRMPAVYFSGMDYWLTNMLGSTGMFTSTVTVVLVILI